MNVKKYAQNKVRRSKNDRLIEGKQNQFYQNKISIDESKFKQFSVDLHKLSQNQDRKNIIKQDISICLSQSQYKTFAENQEQKCNQSKNLTQQVCQITKNIKSKEYSNINIKDLLSDQLKFIKDVQLKSMVNIIVQRCKPDQSIPKNIEPIGKLVKEGITDLQQKLKQLKQKNNELTAIKNMQKTQKQYIKHTLKSIYQRQLKEIQQLQNQNNKPILF